MQTAIRTLTEIEAVNRILSTIGAEKVSDLTSLSLIADSAYQHLRDSLRDLQSHPWGFNTQENVELKANGFGQIRWDVNNKIDTTPDAFYPGWHTGTGTTRGADGTPGPYGHGIAHHWGNHTDISQNTYKYWSMTRDDYVDETYYTASVFVKYHSSLTTTVQIFDNESPLETKSAITITWNTDGTIASTSTSVTGVEGGDDDTPADTTTPPLAAASYESFGKGWYRLIVTVKVEYDHFENQLKFQINPRKADAFGSTYLWGPQITYGAHAYTYEEGLYNSSMVASVDLAPENAGNLDVVLRQDSTIGSAGSIPDMMLFDRKSNRFDAFSGTYKATVTYYLQYEDCPEAAKIYATAMAAVNFQATQIGNAQVDQILRQQLLAAKSAFESYEASQESWSIFDNYDLFKIVNTSQRPIIGGGSPNWGGSR